MTSCRVSPSELFESHLVEGETLTTAFEKAAIRT